MKTRTSLGWIFGDVRTSLIVLFGNSQWFLNGYTTIIQNCEFCQNAKAKRYCTENHRFRVSDLNHT